MLQLPPSAPPDGYGAVRTLRAQAGRGAGRTQGGLGLHGGRRGGFSRMIPRRPIADRLWERVNKGGSCWTWLGPPSKEGYGRVGAGGKTGRLLLVHRVAYELVYGAIPEGLLVCHSCDTPSCVNPAHLWLGTHKTNAADKKCKGRGLSLIHI